MNNIIKNTRLEYDKNVDMTIVEKLMLNVT